MVVVIAGGGTGGHVFPALVVGELLREKGAEVSFIGTKKGIESELVPKRGWKIAYLNAAKWKGQGVLSRLSTPFTVLFATIRAMTLLRKIKPSVVIGVGGYVSVPVLIAATMMRIPRLLMEQNAVPGVANRLLGKFANKICITFPASEGYFNKKKVVFTGNPVREEMKEIPRGIPPVSDKFVLLCFGGSQGAKSISEALLASLRILRNHRHAIHVIHQVGAHMDIQIIKDIYEREGFDAEVYRFIDDMADCYARAHLVLCRAGATSISELMVTEKPAVLVPYPFAADNHQEMNARYVSENGGAKLVLNNELSGEMVADIINQVMREPEKLAEMSKAMRAIAKPAAGQQIVEECYRLTA